MPKTHNLYFTSHDAKQVVNGKKTQVTIPAAQLKDLKIGDRIAFKEPILANPGYYDLKRGWPRGVCYEADLRPLHPSIFGGCEPPRDIPARRAPKEATRLFGIVEGITEMPIQDLSDDDIQLECPYSTLVGFADEDGALGYGGTGGGCCVSRSHPQADRCFYGWQGRMAMHWDKQFSAKSGCYATNPMVKKIAFMLVA